MDKEQSTSFRVVVVGAGIAGLIAAHTLRKAGIDHVVLEKGGEVAPPAGASIAIYPHGARILHQIGCLQAAKDACTLMERFVNRMPNGKVVVDSKFFQYIKENHGQDVLLLERRVFLQLLYDALPDESCIRFNAEVVDIEEHVDEVRVKLRDGTVEKADMVLGCDGVHSLVRDLMWQHANQSNQGIITTKEKTSISTRWTCLVGMGPPAPEMGSCTMTCVHNNGYSFLILTQPDKVFFFVFFRLPRPVTWPTQQRFSSADADEAAARVADHPLSESMVFGELWARRIRGSLIPVEEGILKHWHFGRIVLAGDAVHKMTPNIALGGNSTIESIVVLTNHLHRVLAAHSGARPSRHTLSRLFAAYQAERLPRMAPIVDISSLLTRVQAWDGLAMRILATWILPYQRDRAIADQLGEIFRTAPRLEFVDAVEGGGGEFAGKMAWADGGGLPGLGKRGAAGSKDGSVRVRGALVGDAGGKAWLGSRLLQLIGAVGALVGGLWLVALRASE